VNISIITAGCLATGMWPAGNEADQEEEGGGDGGGGDLAAGEKYSMHCACSCEPCL
jgi:hypothetical protein